MSLEVNPEEKDINEYLLCWSMELLLRKYQPSDQESILHLHRQALIEVGIHTYNDKDLYVIDEEYFSNNGEFLVGIVDDQVIAMGGLHKIDSVSAKIVRMRVHPDWRRKGIGQALLQRLEKKAQELGYQTLLVETLAIRIVARQFYVKNGYVQVSVERPEEDVVYFEKKLR